MSTNDSRETNIPLLQWRRVSDMRKVSECGRYIVDRHPNYSQHPAMVYEYIAKHAGLGFSLLGTFETFDLAAAACERDLSDQPQPKGK